MNRLLGLHGSAGFAFLVQACGGLVAADPNDSRSLTGSGGSTIHPSGGAQTGLNGTAQISGAVGGSTGVVGLSGPVGGSTAQGGQSSLGGSYGAMGGNTGITGAMGGYTGAQGGSTGAKGGSTGATTAAMGGNTGITGAMGGTTGALSGSTVAKGGNTGTTGTMGGYTGAQGGSSGGPTGSTVTVVTSNEGNYWNVQTVPMGPTGTTGDVSANTGSTGTTWDGFGGAFSEMGWNLLGMLSPPDRERALQLLFGTDGAHFTFGRVPIGANEFAMDRYTLDEIPKDAADDYSMERFSIERDRQFLILYIKAVLRIRSDIRLWASPWTPPTWMKDSAAFDGGKMRDDAQTLAAYALYLAKFVESYRNEGISIESVYVQNEPSNVRAYPSCKWSAELTTNFIGKYLGPTFDARGIKAQICVGPLSNPDDDLDTTLLTSVLADSDAKKYVKGVGVQERMIKKWSTIWTPSKVQTAHAPGNDPGSAAFVETKAPNDYAYAIESWASIRNWLNSGVTAYTVSNMVLDTVGKSMDTTHPWPQNALLTVDTLTKALRVTPAYYVFRHLSQFVGPKASLLPVYGTADALAFRNEDRSVVIVLYNAVEAKSMTASVNGKSVKFSMPGNGWATLYWKN
jgi:glucosylceramidase